MSLPAATCPTDWSGYWQAAAIFFTGIAAVLAAWWVGNGQNKINLLERRYDFIKEMSVQLYSSLNDHDRQTDFKLILRNADMAQLIFRHDDIEALMTIVDEVQDLNGMKHIRDQAMDLDGANNFEQSNKAITDKQAQIEADLKSVIKRLKRHAEVTF